jgi:tRNA wybutosine-synthesizing protein 2
MVESQFEQIKKVLSKEIPSDLISKLPDKWEKVGEVGIVKLNPEFEKYSESIGKNYAEILQCKTILNDIGGITGTFREPKTKIIFGSRLTETIHIENGIRFKLDPQRIMFSSGNMDERIRMATISNEDEIVVDLFAGIGYFTLPIAVHSKPKKIFACELNPVAYGYLCENIALNNVPNIVEPLKGDNRKVAPKSIADRVILGYFGDTHNFLNIALDCLKNHKGIIHYHDKFPDRDVPDKP